MSQQSETIDSSESHEEYTAREVEIASMNRDFSNYTSDGNFCVYFKLVRSRREVEEDLRRDTFFPDFVHQFFTEREHIFGYKKPVLRLFYSASRLKRYVKFDYEDKLSKEKDGIDPDDVMQQLGPILEDREYTHDLNTFLVDVDSEREKNFRPPGDMLVEFSKSYVKPKMISRAQKELQGSQQSNGTNGTSRENGTSSRQNGTSMPSSSETQCGDSSSGPTKKHYQIYHANFDTKNFDQYQERMQTLIMWFIESANMIDQDPRWDFFMIFERYNPTSDNDSNATAVSIEDRYYFAGYASVYRYFAYPDRIRPRVSQMLILPPYRRNKLGTALLQSIYEYYQKISATLDITTEDPDEDFISVRDFLDCKNCLKLDSFSTSNLKRGWSYEIAKEAQAMLKLSNRQARKVYEILKLRSLDSSNEEEEKAYRLEIKNRLNIPNRRLQLDCDKVEKLGIELPEAMRLQKERKDYTLAALDENYRELEVQYRRTISKLNQDCE